MLWEWNEGINRLAAGCTFALANWMAQFDKLRQNSAT
jgi:hypothetical protein